MSTHGFLPACRTLDCASIFAETCADATRVFQVARGFDAADTYSRVPAPGQGAAPGFGGQGTEVEVLAAPEESVGSFLNAIPPPLSLGTLRLADGSTVKGFLCEPAGISGAQEIPHVGGWRKYIQELI